MKLRLQDKMTYNKLEIVLVPFSFTDLINLKKGIRMWSAAILDVSADLERYTREYLLREATVQHYRYNLTKILRIAKKT